MIMNMDQKVYIAGHSGMVGSAIMRRCQDRGYTHIITRSHDDLDLTVQKDVEDFFRKYKPDIVILAAGKVGGIKSNNACRADFIYENLTIESNVIHSSYKHGVEKCIFLGSSCIYPRDSTQPMREEYLLDGKCEPTNEPFAIAKIAGIMLCESYWKQYGCNFYSIIPANMYGPNDNFDLETSHVVSALLLNCHRAKELNEDDITLWGTGRPLRELLYVEDLAEACVHLMETVNAKDIYRQGITHLNIGTGKEISIRDLSQLVSKVVGYDGDIRFDTSYPDGMPRRLLDIDRMTKWGWQARTPIEEGVALTYEWWLNHTQGN